MGKYGSAIKDQSNFAAYETGITIDAFKRLGCNVNSQQGYTRSSSTAAAIPSMSPGNVMLRSIP